MLTQKRIEEILNYITSVQVTLDPDPIRRGPKYLNNMVAQTRNLTNNVQEYEREVETCKMRLNLNLNHNETEYEMRYNDLLVNNSEVASAGTSFKDREAKVRTILKDLMGEISELKSNIVSLGHVESVIQSKLRELRDVSKDIKTQMRLIESEIKIGNFWGDQSENGQHRITGADIPLEVELNPPGDPEKRDEAFKKDFETPESDDSFEELLANVM